MSLRILITVASKHGSTEEIGDSIAQTLLEKGFLVDVLPLQEASEFSLYDGVIVGSAIYAGNWMKTAHTFITNNAEELASRPVWLFSSGPIGTHPEPEHQEIMHMNEYMQRTKCVEHRIFSGSISADKLSLAEKLVVRALKVDYGDYRDWDEITKWARSIARHLKKTRK